MTVDRTTRALVRLAASLTAGEKVQVTAMDRAADVAPEKAEEVLLQSYLFLGIPAALNALGLWRRRTERPPPEPAEEDPAAWAERGVEVCRRVYGPHYEALREVMSRIQPELDRWAIAEGYGKVLGRSALDLKTRELCIVCQLSGTDATRQLHAHLRGCMNVGIPPARVEEALEAVRDIIGRRRARTAHRVWDRVRERWERQEGSQDVR